MNVGAVMVGRVHSVINVNRIPIAKTVRALYPGNVSVWTLGEEPFVIKVRWLKLRDIWR
jgi:hypothetical protein